jgi:nitroimidazol reductase NimA-like FMN-containing flavoprotein (pyridoxamine 5'-phosphate oxidase superfamily)
VDILTPDEIIAVVSEACVAHIGVRPGGDPYVTSVSYVPFGNGIAFRSLSERRLDAIASNPRVSVEVTVVDHETGSWKSVVASGRSSVVDDSQEAAESFSYCFSNTRHRSRVCLATNSPR